MGFQKSKSRSKLWDAISGTKEFVGTAGLNATWTVLFNEAATNGDVYVIGGYYFQFVTDGGEDTPGDSEGTSADPHLITIGGTPTATTAAASLVAALVLETTTTGAWGFLHPVNATGASSSTGTATINFYPGTQANSATYITATVDGAAPTITKTQTGTSLPILSIVHGSNVIDTTGYDTVNAQYYDLPDGKAGDECKVVIKTITASDTPRILGHLLDASTANVYAQFGAAGGIAKFIWNGTKWAIVDEIPAGAITFVAAS